MNEDRCVVCDDIIPEGRMVCHKCEYITQSFDTTKPKEEIDYILAGIGINGEQVYLGVYKTFDEAVKARKEAEKKYFGEYSFENSMSKTKEETIV